MKLSALARETEVSTASIKYCIHVRILPPGIKRNATTAVYAQSHIDRLRLITFLRRELGSSIDSFTALTQAIDDETLENIDVLGELGWPDISPSAVTSMAHVLQELSVSGYPVGRDTIVRNIQALTEVAGRNTAPITDNLSRDRTCIVVIRGITMHNRLLLATSALVHASLSALPRASDAAIRHCEQ